MFVGSSEHNLDSKGRLVLPHKFRDAFEGKAYLSLSNDDVLGLWTESEFLRRMQILSARMDDNVAEERRFRRLTSMSQEVEIEPSQGRIAIPERLRRHSNLTIGSPVLITGFYKHIELWNPGDFEARVLNDLQEGGTPA